MGLNITNSPRTSIWNGKYLLTTYKCDSRISRRKGFLADPFSMQSICSLPFYFCGGIRASPGSISTVWLTISRKTFASPGTMSTAWLTISRSGSRRIAGTEKSTMRHDHSGSEHDALLEPRKVQCAIAIRAQRMTLCWSRENTMRQGHSGSAHQLPPQKIQCSPNA